MFNSLRATDWAYTAGLVDGEGNIRVRDFGRGRVGTEVVIGNTDKSMIDWLHSKFGGTVTGPRKSKTLKNAKPWWDWFLPAKYQQEFLQGILPYLVNKKRCAEIMLEIRATMTWRNRPIVDNSILTLRTSLLSEFKQLNKLGL